MKDMTQKRVVGDSMMEQSEVEQLERGHWHVMGGECLGQA